MNTINLSIDIPIILQLMSENGLGTKSIYNYTHTGFGAIMKHFMKQGVSKISLECLNAFVLEQRSAFEKGNFSLWKWQLIRRSCAILKEYVLSGNIDIPMLPTWNTEFGGPRQSITKDTPTEEQLSNPQNVFALTWKVKQQLNELQYSEHTIRHYVAEGLAIILNEHYRHGLTDYSEKLIFELINRKSNEDVACGSLKNLRKAAYLIQEVYVTGKITTKKIPNLNFKNLSAEFAKLLQSFCNHASEKGMIRESSINTAKSAIRNLLFELESRGFYNFDDVELSDVNDVITVIAKKYHGGIGSFLFSIRIFLRFLFESEYVVTDLSIAVPEMFAPKTVYREGFDISEIHKLLDEPDKTQPIGKRDYAIMMLAAQTGLRACDVVSLKFANIDWKASEVHIIQKKTGHPLSLPLQKESRSAMIDYLLNGRPKCNLPYIFLCHCSPTRPLNNRSASGLVSRYMKRAKIDNRIPRRGFHSFRRTFGTNLLQSQTTFDTIQQLLGHSNMNSLKPYLSIDERGLKECALNLVSTPEGGQQQ